MLNIHCFEWYIYFKLDLLIFKFRPYIDILHAFSTHLQNFLWTANLWNWTLCGYIYYFLLIRFVLYFHLFCVIVCFGFNIFLFFVYHVSSIFHALFKIHYLLIFPRQSKRWPFITLLRWFPEALRIPQQMRKKDQYVLAKQNHQQGTVRVRENNSKKYHDPDKVKTIKMVWRYIKKEPQ